MAKTTEKKSGKSVRASVSFPPKQYATLERIAEEKKVSVAWVVREAVDRYLVERWPLLSGADEGDR
jgi:dienelactone hydrolase